MQECRNAGMLECWNAGMQEGWNMRVRARSHNYLTLLPHELLNTNNFQFAMIVGI